MIFFLYLFFPILEFSAMACEETLASQVPLSSESNAVLASDLTPATEEGQITDVIPEEKGSSSEIKVLTPNPAPLHSRTTNALQSSYGEVAGRLKLFPKTLTNRASVPIYVAPVHHAVLDASSFAEELMPGDAMFFKGEWESVHVSLNKPEMDAGQYLTCDYGYTHLEVIEITTNRLHCRQLSGSYIPGSPLPLSLNNFVGFDTVNTPEGVRLDFKITVAALDDYITVDHEGFDPKTKTLYLRSNYKPALKASTPSKELTKSIGYSYQFFQHVQQIFINGQPFLALQPPAPDPMQPAKEIVKKKPKGASAK